MNTSASEKDGPAAEVAAGGKRWDEGDIANSEQPEAYKRQERRGTI